MELLVLETRKRFFRLARASIARGDDLAIQITCNIQYVLLNDTS